MSYLALYRQYRPRTFKEVIGQEHIIKILSAQITGGRVGHAYLFTGSRGTGKTTTAKVFSRALNCLDRLKDGSPCGRCANCENFESIDIIEIDGASSNRVEVIRDLKEQVKYPPVNGRYKVYIIDEVHMLTDSSYNALLKTLEEPPDSVVFLLATTEPHKIPATILSRCMRFDFRLVPTELIAGIIRDIYKKSKVAANEQAISLIARSGQGSVRDALSIADKCIGITDKELTYRDVLQALGASDSTAVAALSRAVLDADLGTIMAEVDRLVRQGKSVSLLAKDLTSYFRDLGVVKTAADPGKILELPDDIIEELRQAAKGADINKIIYCIDIFGGLDRELRYGLMPRIILENACIKAAKLVSEGEITAILARLYELEKKTDFSGSPKNAGIAADAIAEEGKAADNNKIFDYPQNGDGFGIGGIDNTAEDGGDREGDVKQGGVYTNGGGAKEGGGYTKEGGMDVDEASLNGDMSLVERHTVYGNQAPNSDMWSAAPLGGDSRAEKLTALLIKELDDNGEIMLKLALGEAFCRSRLEGSRLVCSVKDGQYHSLLKKPENLKKINGFLEEGYTFDCELVEEDEVIDEEFIKRRLREYGGNKLEIITKKTKK